MPTIHCPTCNQTYDVAPEMIGQKVQCAECNEKFIANADDDAILLTKPVGQKAFAAPPQQPQTQWQQQQQWRMNQPQGIMQPQYGRGEAKNHSKLIIVLLVVIIGILLAPILLSGMLLPALNMSKEKAKQAVCIGNLKQIGLAASVYSISYDAWYPTSTRSISDSFRYPSSRSTSTPGTWLRGDSGNSFELLRSQDLLSDPRGYLCPSKAGITPAQYNQSVKGHVSYNWCDGLMGGNCTMSPVACDGTDNHAQTGRFLRGDGSVGTANGTSAKKWTQDSSFRDFCYNRTYTDFSF